MGKIGAISPVVFEGGKDNRIAQIVNKIVIHAPEYSKFSISDFFNDEFDRLKLMGIQDEIRDRMRDERLIERYNKEFFFVLTDIGREAKKNGGYFLHSKIIEEKEKRKKQREIAETNTAIFNNKVKIILFLIVLIGCIATFVFKDKS